jgi:cell wall-associated NlpC family hydrolase
MNDQEPPGYAAVSPNARRALLGLLGASVLSACSTLPGPARGPWEPDDAADTGPQGRVPEDVAREVTFLALSLVDTPYRYGGNTPAGGFDCSGLIVYVYRTAAGVALPRTVAQLARAGHPVRAGAMRTGDLVLFDTTGRFSHAGIYVGGGRFVHAPSTGGTVRLDGVHARYWKPRFSGVRRV